MGAFDVCVTTSYLRSINVGAIFNFYFYFIKKKVMSMSVVTAINGNSCEVLSFSFGPNY